MKNVKKFLAMMTAAAVCSSIPGMGLIGGAVAWAAEITPVEEVVYDATVDGAVYETVDGVVYDTVDGTVYDLVEDVVYDTVEDVVYATVEDEVYNTVEGHIYYTGIDADIFALVINEKTASVFGEIKENDVEPIIVNDRTMLPARFIAENLGAEVEWDAEARVVTVKNAEVEIKLTIDSDVATVNGVEEKLDSPAFIQNDRTYTPVRFIAEKLGALVDWDPGLTMVLITKAAAEEEAVGDGEPGAEDAVVEDTTDDAATEEVTEETEEGTEAVADEAVETEQVEE